MQGDVFGNHHLHSGPTMGDESRPDDSPSSAISVFSGLVAKVPTCLPTCLAEKLAWLRMHKQGPGVLPRSRNFRTLLRPLSELG